MQRYGGDTIADCNIIGVVARRGATPNCLPISELRDNLNPFRESARHVRQWAGMKVAVPVWQGRVSPVFDVAGQLVLVEIVEGVEVSRHEYPLPSAEPEQRAAQLAGLQVETLICGAISQALEALLSDNGIRVHGRVCGNLDDVLKAFLAGTLGGPEYAMPGCCAGQRRRFRGGRRRGRRSHQ